MTIKKGYLPRKALQMGYILPFLMKKQKSSRSAFMKASPATFIKINFLL